MKYKLMSSSKNLSDYFTQNNSYSDITNDANRCIDEYYKK